MGIYISDLEIPKDKAVRVVIIRDDGVCVDEWGNTYGVVSLPLHGDLIDRDELLSQYGGPIWTAKTDYAEGLRDVVADIKYAAAVIEAEPCNDLAKPNNNIFAVQNADEDEGLFAEKPIDYMHTPSVEEIIEAEGVET